MFFNNVNLTQNKSFSQPTSMANKINNAIQTQQQKAAEKNKIEIPKDFYKSQEYWKIAAQNWANNPPQPEQPTQTQQETQTPPPQTQTQTQNPTQTTKKDDKDDPNKQYAKFGWSDGVNAGLGAIGLVSNLAIAGTQLAHAQDQRIKENARYDAQVELNRKATQGSIDAASGLKGAPTNMQGTEPKPEKQTMPLEAQ